MRRYNIYASNDGDGHMDLMEDEDPTGEWVRYRDLTAQPSLRGTEGAPRLVNSLLVSICSVLHKNQRYDTCGDYWEGSGGNTVIVVSELPDHREMLLIAIHELIEWTLCQFAGISNEEIDDFDKNHLLHHSKPESSNKTFAADEPGDCTAAPYYRQHQIASGIERLLAAELGVDWLTYERHIEELSK